MTRQDRQIESLMARDEREIDKILTVNYRLGDEFEKRIGYYLVRDPETGEVRWEGAPGSFYEGPTRTALPPFSPSEFSDDTMKAWLDANYRLSQGLLSGHKAAFLNIVAHLLNEKYVKEWATAWETGRSEIYRELDGLFKQHQYTDLKALAVGDGYSKIAGNIIKAISDNENPADVIRRIREQVFGLGKGERNRYLTYRATMLYRTEMKYAEKIITQEALRSNRDIYGIRVRYYGGPCNSGLCMAILMAGHNVRVEGDEIVADFWFDRGGLLFPPFHPNCHCAVVEYLRAYDFAHRGDIAGGLGQIPAKGPTPWFRESPRIYGPPVTPTIITPRPTPTPVPVIVKKPRPIVEKPKKPKVAPAHIGVPKKAPGVTWRMPGEIGAPPTFKAAGEAEAWIRGKISWLDAEFEGATIGAMNEAVAGFAEAVNTLPESVTDLGYFGTTRRRGKFGRRRVFSGEYAHFSRSPMRPLEDALRLNPTWFGNEMRFRKSLSDCVATGFHPVGCESIKSVVHHEYGHVIDKYIRKYHYDEYMAFRNEMKAKKLMFINSRYAHGASDMYAEMWAESYASAMNNPRSQWEDFTKAQMSMIDRIKRKAK